MSLKEIDTNEYFYVSLNIINKISRMPETYLMTGKSERLDFVSNPLHFSVNVCLRVHVQYMVVIVQHVI